MNASATLSGWRLWVAWVVATTIGGVGIGGLYAVFPLLRDPLEGLDNWLYLLGFVLAPALIFGVLLVPQTFVLRRAFGTPAWSWASWTIGGGIAGTLSVTAVVLLVGLAVKTALEDGPLVWGLLALAATTGGLVLGWCQSRALRGYTADGLRWVGATALGLLGLIAVVLPLMRLPQLVSWPICAAAYGAITGFGLLWLRPRTGAVNTTLAGTETAPAAE